MNLQSNTYLNDITNNVNFKTFDNKNILITGATGLIGHHLVESLLYLRQKHCLKLKIILLARDNKKVSKYLNFNNVETIIIKDITSPIKYNGKIDYIVHAAGIAQSKIFVDNPQLTIDTNVGGTFNLLNFAIGHKCQSFVYISSLEVYGKHCSDQLLDEAHKIELCYHASRDSYPISKRLSEIFCLKYYQEYKLSTKILRFSQVISPSFNDNRLSSYLVKCANKGENIILKSTGKSKRNYLYIADAVNAILVSLLSKQGGEIYNVASDNTYTSIIDLAKCFAKSNKSIKVIKKPINANYYFPDSKINFDTQKIQRIGFKSSVKNLNQLVKKVVK